MREQIGKKSLYTREQIPTNYSHTREQIAVKSIRTRVTDSNELLQKVRNRCE